MTFYNLLYKTALAGLLMTGAVSCSKDFVDLNNPQSLPLEGTIKDLSSLTNATNGVYSYFQEPDYYNRTFILFPDLMSDNAFISRRNVGFYLNYDNAALSSNDGNALGAWAAMYRVISNANLAIAGGEALAVNADQQANVNQVIGEMYAARALAHFDLVRLFAQPYTFTADAAHPGVPVVTTPQKEIAFPARNTVKEVYDQVIADFTKALTLLNVAKKGGYFTSDAAKALLSKVYLYKGDWTNAETYASQAIASGNQALLTNEQYVGSWAEDFSSESIFEIENTPTDRPAVNGIGFFYEQTAYGDALATKDLYDTYAETDVRKQLIEEGVRENAENPAYIVHKYPKGLTTQDDNIKVIRLSEVYLIRAEAFASQPGKETQALADLNTIIKRADPLAVPETATGQALIDRIILERRKELAFEGNRLFDLTRRKMDVQLIQSDKTTVIPYGAGRLILPIPLAEKNANPDIQQNEGY